MYETLLLSWIDTTITTRIPHLSDNMIPSAIINRFDLVAVDGVARRDERGATYIKCFFLSTIYQVPFHSYP